MNLARLLTIIIRPHVSEKSSVLTEKRNQYAFKIALTATKTEVKDAIEYLFKTKVKSVDIVNVKPKKKMFRGSEGTRKKWKKAYVTLMSDQAIDFLGAQK